MTESVSSSQLAPRLQAALQTVAGARFDELYEESPGTAPLAAAVADVIDALSPQMDPEGQTRLVVMALAMAEACAPTILAFHPDDPRPAQALSVVRAWLTDPSGEVPDPNTLFPWRPTGAQALNESQDVFHQLLRSLDPDQARDALLTLLEDCFEGYAVQIGVDPHRRVFDWWLQEVVPAAAMKELPARIYRHAPLPDEQRRNTPPRPELTPTTVPKKLTYGRWTLWTDGAHPFAPQNDHARRQLALELYVPKGGMITWLYLIVAPPDDVGPLAGEAVEQTQYPDITSRLYSAPDCDSAPQRPEETARAILALREAGLRVPSGAMLQMGVGGELAALWAMAANDLDTSIPLGRAAAEAWAQGARRAQPGSLRLVGAAWEEVGINLVDLIQMARVLGEAQAKPPTTADELEVLVTRAYATPPEGSANSPLR